MQEHFTEIRNFGLFVKNHENSLETRFPSVSVQISKSFFGESLLRLVRFLQKDNC